MKKKIVVGMVVIVSMVGVCWGWQDQLAGHEEWREHGRDAAHHAQDKIADVIEHGRVEAAADTYHLKPKYEAAKERASQAMGDIGAQMRRNVAEL
ncbi:hypothetical protein V6N13_112365 [Hibiscus sabdariffa]|uniref:Late embryogenesis abundant protein n=1 Tax=Hibiscus sabdariffa TaxID=183260 RepID=A0ABR2TNJ6_9ROSI